MKALRYLRDALVFAPCYVALDWTSHVYPLGPFNITPWNPQAALAIVWMLLGGVRYLPAVAATIFVADVIVRGAPGGYALIGITALTLASGYAGVAYVLRDRLGPTLSVNGTRPLALFAVVTIAGTGLVGAAFIAVLRGADFLTDTSFVVAWLRFWVGDGVGVLVTAPLLLAAADAESRRAFLHTVRRPETIAQTAALMATGWFVFRGADVDPSKLFYLFFLPLIWIVVRAGMAGALIAIAIAQLTVVLGIHSGVHTPVEVFELQVFVAALALTALFLGVTVEERERAATTLRQSLRLAAAGEMAGAVAHEVNQPLTALANYGRSAQLVLARNGEAAELASIIDRMLAEGRRAGEILRRVRDFFRAGTTRLEPVAVDEVLAAARRIAEQAIGSRPVTFAIASDPALPPLYVDRLQIELILRNLISNAVEATASQASGEIRVMAEREDAQHVRLAVADSGPGVAADVRERLFEPFSSTKSSGMGLGLAVSRAIAEAHGGSLDMRAGLHGEFHLVLPCVQES
jgi:two-component system, LuxR family, sensor kinase FixL